MKWLMNYFKQALRISCLISSLCWSCNLEKEITIELPEYERKLVLECYLEPGGPFRMLLSQSFSYFAPFDTSAVDLLSNLLVNGAIVNIRHRGRTYPLGNQIILNSTSTKLYNYFNKDLVPANYNDPFELLVELPDGSTIIGETAILPPVALDSVVVEFRERDTVARALTYFTDIPNERNYYRRMLHHHSLNNGSLQDFTVDDRFVEDAVVFGSGYDFAPGDTIFNTLFHIERSYHDFLESVNNAINSNGNPFGQPNPINSNLEGTAGAIGIFTGLSYVREETIVGEP